MKTTRQWDRLDNAALIYTSTLSSDYATKFRTGVTLYNRVERKVLDAALSNVIGRFPSFRYALRKGLYWWYFKSIEDMPEVGESRPLDALPFDDESGYLFKIGCNGCQITLDVFHSLTDGTGALTFLLTVAGEYLRLVEGIVPEYNQWVLDPFQAPENSEVEDGFDYFSGGKGTLETGGRAYHIKGKSIAKGALNNLRISMSTDDLVKVSREHGCTVTELLSSAMIMSLQRMRAEDPSARRSPLMKICIPVNLRPIFGVHTLRNFSSYVNLGIDVTSGNYTLDETIREVALQKKLETSAHQLRSKVSANVKLEDNVPVRCVPRVIKKQVMAYMHKAKGDMFCSQTLSNIGNVTLPESMVPFVTDIDFQLGRQLSLSGACACVSYNGKTSLNISRRIAEDKFEKYLTRELQSLGITIYSMRETLGTPASSRPSRMIARRTLEFLYQSLLGTLLIPAGLAWSHSDRLKRIFGPFFMA